MQHLLLQTAIKDEPDDRNLPRCGFHSAYPLGLQDDQGGLAYRVPAHPHEGRERAAATQLPGGHGGPELHWRPAHQLAMELERSDCGGRAVARSHLS